MSSHIMKWTLKTIHKNTTENFIAFKNSLITAHELNFEQVSTDWFIYTEDSIELTNKWVTILRINFIPVILISDNKLKISDVWSRL